MHTDRAVSRPKTVQFSHIDIQTMYIIVNSILRNYLNDVRYIFKQHFVKQMQRESLKKTF